MNWATSLAKTLGRAVGIVALFAASSTGGFAATDCVSYKLVEPHVHLVTVDLQCDGVKIVGTPASARGNTTSDFAHRAGVVAAINANFFDRRSLRAYGRVVTDGVVWGDADSLLRPTPWLACSASNQCEIGLPEESKLAGVPKFAVSGMQYLDADGFKCHPAMKGNCHTDNWNKPNPRTLAGLAENGRVLGLVVVEGRQRDFAGLTLDEAAALMRKLKFNRALNLDGGGSTTLVWHGGRISLLPDNQPSERPVANQLGIGLSGGAR